MIPRQEVAGNRVQRHAATDGQALAKGACGRPPVRPANAVKAAPQRTPKQASAA
jgi:hypothetical protein